MESINNLNLLFVDDEKYFAKPTADLLELEGAKVTYFIAGEEVLAYLDNNKKAHIDLIILDIMMPEGGDRIVTTDRGRSTGVVLYNIIRNVLHWDIPILVVTAIDINDRLFTQTFTDDKKVAILNKPFLFSELVHEINNLLRVKGA